MKGVGVAGRLLVLAVLLFIGLAMAVPGELCARGLAHNDTAAIATLRNLVPCQERFREFGGCSPDGGRGGAYGTFGEMTGASGIRSDRWGRERGDPLPVPILSSALASVDADGIVTKAGYCFRILLPAEGGGAAHESRPGAPFDRAVDATAAADRWCAYAWPAKTIDRMRRCFFVSTRGEVLSTPNADGRYEGTAHPPEWDAAMPEDGWGTAWAPAPGDAKEYRGRDGNLWKRTN